VVPVLDLVNRESSEFSLLDILSKVAYWGHSIGVDGVKEIAYCHLVNAMPVIDFRKINSMNNISTWIPILTLLLFLTACTDRQEVGQVSEFATDDSILVSSPASSPPERDGIEDSGITIQFAINDVYINDYDDLIAAYEREHPTVQIQVKSIEAITVGMGDAEPGEVNRRIAQAADIFPNQYAFGPNWQQLTLDLTPFMAATPNFNQDDFPPGILQEPDGTVRALPLSLNPVLLFYNKDLFTAAGLAEPQPGWTWDEFRASAKALTIRDGDQISQWGLVHAFPGSLDFYASQLDSWLIDWSQEPPRPRFTDPDVVAAVQQHTDLYLVDGVGPDETTIEAYNEAESLIAAGQAAMWPAFYYELERYAGEQNVGVVTFPRNDGNGRPETTMIHVDSFAMSAGTTQPQAAWEWLTFLSRQTPIVPGAIPARASTREAAGLWRDVAPEVQRVVDDALAHSFKYYFSPVNRIFAGAVTEILTQDKPVAESLVAAQSAGQQLLGASAQNEELDSFVVTADETDNTETVTISFLPFNSNDIEGFRLLAEAFAVDHPNIRVDIKIAKSGIYNPVKVDNKGNPGDCFQISLPDLQNPEERSAYLRLNPLVEADPTFNLDDFYPALVGQLTYQGKLWGLPADFKPLIIEYNKELFDMAGVAYPQPGWSMQDFLETAVALTTSEGEAKQYGFVPEANEPLTFMSMIQHHGARLFNTSIDPPMPTFTDPSTIEAVRWYVNLSQIYGVKPVFVLDVASSHQIAPFTKERQHLILTGQAGMWTRLGNDGLESLSNQINIGAVSLPVNPDNPAQELALTTAYFISADTPHRQACWEWIKFLTTADANTGAPARRSLAESVYRQRVGDEIAMVHIASIEQMAATSDNAPIARKGFFPLWLQQAVAQIVADDIPVEAALAVAQEMAEAYRNCIIDQNALGFEAELACVNETDPSILPKGAKE